MGSEDVNPGACECAWQLSTINCTLWFWARNFWSNCFIQSVKISESIQLFLCALYIHGKDVTFLKHLGFLAFPMASSGHGKDVTFLKHLGFLAFPMASSGNFTPAVFAALSPVCLTLLCLSPMYFSRFSSRVLFGSAWKRLNSSALKISCNLYLDSIVSRCVFFECAIISGVHNFTSPDTVLNVTLFCAFHL